MGTQGEGELPRPTRLRKNGPKERAVSQTPIAKACSPLPFTLRLASEGVSASGEQVFLHTLSSSQVIVKSRRDVMAMPFRRPG